MSGQALASCAYVQAQKFGADERSCLMTSWGFVGRPPSKEASERLPPGQYKTDDFPVLSMGPTPHVDRGVWRFTINDGTEAAIVKGHQ